MSQQPTDVADEPTTAVSPDTPSTPPAELPEHARLFNQANALFRQGLWQQAAEALAESLALDATLEPALLLLARCAVRQGELKLARRQFATLLRQYPQNYSGWLEAGHVCRQLGLLDQALASYERAVVVAPQRYEARMAAARVFEESDRPDEAAAEYHRALQSCTAGQRKYVHRWMAQYRLERGDAARALEAMRQALLVGRLEPYTDDNEKAEFQIDLGEIFQRLNLHQDAEQAFTRAAAATAEGTLTRLAETLFRFNLVDPARQVLHRSLELHPNSPTAHWNLAHLQAESWQMQDAEALLAKAEALAPQPGARQLRATMTSRLGDVDQALQLYRSIADDEGPLSKARSSAAMCSLYSDKLSATEVAELHRALFAPLAQLSSRERTSFARDLSRDRKLRLGILSADFHHQHPVNIFMQPVLARLDPKAFDTTIYFTGITYDEQTHLARRRVPQWVQAATMNDDQLARRIDADQIDILLDLSGHTALNRISLLAQRAAPVQISFLGYPGSTGVPQVDGLIADPIVAPTGSEHLFSEQVLRLPHTVFCYAPEADYPYPAYDASHAQRPLTFGSFNNLPKLTPRTLTLWSDVLKAVPDSRLLLKAPSFMDAGAIALFKQRFEALGISADRLEFRGPVGLTDMMAEYADVDIALDPVPYNGGTTTMQALWMGVPTIVQAGSNFVSRMGASFMTAAGLHDWVAADDTDYVQIAVNMAADREGLLALKQGLRHQLQAAPGWDINQYTLDLQAVLRQAWTAYVDAQTTRKAD